MAEYLTPEERAERVVKVYPESEPLSQYTLRAGDYKTRIYRPREAADRAASQLRAAVAAALRDHEQGLYALALADGPGGASVSAERETETRRVYHNDGKPWTERPINAGEVGDLLALLDHARQERDHALARLAHLGCDEGLALARAFDDGEKAGEVKGWKAARAACVEAAKQKTREIDKGSEFVGALATANAVQSVPEVPPTSPDGP